MGLGLENPKPSINHNPITLALALTLTKPLPQALDDLYCQRPRRLQPATDGGLVVAIYVSAFVGLTALARAMAQRFRLYEWLIHIS